MPSHEPTWTHEKSQAWRRRYWQALLDIGLDPDELYMRGTVEQHILGYLICANGNASIDWVPKEFTKRLYRSTPVTVKVGSVSKEDVLNYTIGVMLRRLDGTNEPVKKVAYEIEGAGDVYNLQRPFVHVPEHACKDTIFSGFKKLRKMCKHNVAALLAVQEKLPGMVDGADVDISITPFFVGDEVPPPELISYYETLLKSPKVDAIERKVKLYEFIRGKHRVYRV